MKKLYTILLIAMLALVSSWAEAQNFDNVNIAEASSVCSVAQDECGVLWFGTDNGLFAYDGYRTISPSHHLTTSPPHHLNTRIHSMLMLHDVLYMATERGLMVYDIRRGRFETLGGSTHGEMRAVTMYGGRVWFGGAQGLFSIDTKSGAVRTESARLRNVYSLLATKHGLLVGTISGLSLLRGAKTQHLLEDIHLGSSLRARTGTGELLCRVKGLRHDRLHLEDVLIERRTRDDREEKDIDQLRDDREQHHEEEGPGHILLIVDTTAEDHADEGHAGRVDERRRQTEEHGHQRGCDPDR